MIERLCAATRLPNLHIFAVLPGFSVGFPFAEFISRQQSTTQTSINFYKRNLSKDERQEQPGC